MGYPAKPDSYGAALRGRNKTTDGIEQLLIGDSLWTEIKFPPDYPIIEEKLQAPS